MRPKNGHAGNFGRTSETAFCFRYGLLRFGRNDDFDAWPATERPDGQITRKSVHPCSEKYSAFAVGQISDLTPRVSPKMRGGSRSS
ncbi:hypothetical protein AAFX91_24990, partial [Bradyrhizobium sp. 31Argb]